MQEDLRTKPRLQSSLKRGAHKYISFFLLLLVSFCPLGAVLAQELQVENLGGLRQENPLTTRLDGQPILAQNGATNFSQNFSTPLQGQALNASSPSPDPKLLLVSNQPPEQLKGDRILQEGHKFFGTISRQLAKVIQDLTAKFGTPNAYILGQEGSVAFVAGVRYGEGLMYTQNGSDQRVYWQGPSVGFDAGGEGARTMFLVYNLPSIEAIYRRFGGVDGSAYVIGGLGITVLTSDNIVLVPIRSGVGLRLGVNISSLKFTRRPTWNPF